VVGLKNEQDTRILRRLHRNFYADDEFVHGITLLQRLCIWSILKMIMQIFLGGVMLMEESEEQ
jgi:hypothetical protein